MPVTKISQVLSDFYIRWMLVISQKPGKSWDSMPGNMKILKILSLDKTRVAATHHFHGPGQTIFWVSHKILKI